MTLRTPVRWRDSCDASQSRASIDGKTHNPPDAVMFEGYRVHRGIVVTVWKKLFPQQYCDQWIPPRALIAEENQRVRLWRNTPGGTAVPQK